MTFVRVFILRIILAHKKVDKCVGIISIGAVKI